MVQFGGMALAMLVGVTLARALGPEGLGIYSIAMSIAAILSVVIEFGTPTYVMKAVAAAHVRNDHGNLYATIAWAKKTTLLSSCLVALCALAVLQLFASGISVQLRATVSEVLVLGPLLAIAKIQEAAMRGMNMQLVGQTPLLIARPAFFLAGMVLCLHFSTESLTAPQAMRLQLLSMLLVAVTISLITQKKVAPYRNASPLLRFDPRGAIQSALPMAVTEGLRVTLGQMAILLLGLLSNATATGLFKAADSVGLLCCLPMTVLNVAVAPVIARLHHEGNTGRLKKVVSITALGMVLGSFAFLLAAVLYGETMLALMFGAKYSHAAMPMLILCVGYSLGATLGPTLVFMNMTGRERTVTRSFVYAMLASCVVGVPAILFLGAVGAAIANVSAYFVWNFLLWLGAKRIADIDTSLYPALSALFSRSASRK